MNWNHWLDEVIVWVKNPRLILKAEQLSLFGLASQSATKTPKPKKAQKTTKKPAPIKFGPPPGGGWKKTKKGWSRGRGKTYEWRPLEWWKDLPEKNSGGKSDKPPVKLKRERIKHKNVPDKAKNVETEPTTEVEVRDPEFLVPPRRGKGKNIPSHETHKEGIKTAGRILTEEINEKEQDHDPPVIPDGRKVTIPNPAVTLHKEFLPEIEVKLKPSVENFPVPCPLYDKKTGKLKGRIEKLFPHQKEAAERILTSWKKRDGFLLSDEAGLGKTNTALAAMVQNGGKRNLIVVPTAGKEGLKAQWSGPEACGLYDIHPKGVDEMSATEPGWYIISYDELLVAKRDAAGDPIKDKNGKIKYELRKEIFDGKWDAIAFDECHNMHGGKQGVGNRARAAKVLQKNADKVVYMSATPFGGMKDLHYLSKLGMWKESESGSDEPFLGWATRAGAMVKGNTIESVSNPTTRHPMARVAATMLCEGMILNRQSSMDGVTADFSMVKKTDLTKEQKQAFGTADRIIEMASGHINSMMLEAMYVGWSKQYWEVCKVKSAIEAAKKELYNDDGSPTGKQVAFFCSFRTMTHSHLRNGIPNMLRRRAEKLSLSGAPGAEQRAEALYQLSDRIEEVAAELPEVVPPVDQLTQYFGGPHKVSEIHGGTNKSPAGEQDAYQAGHKEICVATMARGGTGISLHDKVGTAPRVQINLSLPWTGREFNQVAGRSHRLGSKSETMMKWLVGDMPKEIKNASCVSERLRDMNALTAGDPLVKPDASELAAWQERSSAAAASDNPEDEIAAIESMERKKSEVQSEAADVSSYFEDFARQIMEGRDVIEEGFQLREKNKASKAWTGQRYAAQQLREGMGWDITYHPGLNVFEIERHSIIRKDHEKFFKSKKVGGKTQRYGGKVAQSFWVPPEGMQELAKKAGVHDTVVDMNKAVRETRKPSEHQKIVAELAKEYGLRIKETNYEGENDQKVYLISGNTYIHQKAFWRGRGKWERSERGYLVPSGNLNEVLEQLRRIKRDSDYYTSFYRSMIFTSNDLSKSHNVRLVIHL